MTHRYACDRLVNPDGTLERCEIQVEDGLIRSVTPLARLAGPEEKNTHAFAIPGFIDIHTHGGAGHDIMDGDDDRFSQIARYHLNNGTTSFLGSTATAPLTVLDRVLRSAGSAMRSNAVEAARGLEATFLGIHLEGPWISPEKAGAQNPSYMHAPDNEAMAFIRNHAEVLRMVTFSYHYPAADQLLDLLLELNIIPACGHDETIDDRILHGFERGLRHITHLYSMTSSFQRVDGLKHLGTLEMALMTPGVTVEVIADGKHVTEHIWRFIAHNKQSEEIVVVSDSMRWAGMPDDPGRIHKLGDVDAVVADGVAWLADRSAFAGSVSTMHLMFKRLVRDWGVKPEDAVKMTSTNQAGELGLGEQLGSIEPGKAADFLILDDDLAITHVVKAGHVVHPQRS